MNVASALRSGVRLPVQCVWTVLPFFLLSTSAVVVARVPLLAGLAVALFVLRVQGRIEPVVRALDSLDPGQLDPGDPTTLPTELIEALGGLVTPTVVAVLGLGTFAFVVVWLVAQRVAAAATLSAVYAALDGSEPLSVGVRGGVRHWRAFLGLAVVRLVLVGVAFVPLGIGGLVALGVGEAAGVLVAITAGLVSLVLALVVFLSLTFADQSVVVDGVGVRGAVRQSLGFVRRRPVDFLAYLVVAGGVALAMGSVAAVFNLVGVPQLTAVVVLVVGPVMSEFKTALYAEVELAAGPVATDEGRSRRSQVARGLRRGWSSLGRFVRTHSHTTLASAAVLTVGVVVGWFFTAPYGVTIAGPEDPETVFGTVAVGPFVNIATNNWLVAVGSGYGGLALGLPTVTGLLFNGALVGALAGVFDRTAFVALVAPHGVIELPALAVAGGLGLHLGRVGWRGLRGQVSAAAVGEELGSAFEVLVGLAVVFVVAAFVEAFLTPQIAAFVLGG